MKKKPFKKGLLVDLTELFSNRFVEGLEALSI